MIRRIKNLGAGFILSAALGYSAFQLSGLTGWPASLLALLLGVGCSFLYARAPLTKGIEWSSKFILRLGVALLGMRIVFGDLLALGWQGAMMIVSAITITIITGMILSRALGMNKAFGALTGGAVAICGASAAMAISAILPEHKHKERDLTLTIMGITAFSTTAMVLYPFIGNALGLDAQHMALFLGGAIHDVAQTAGAGFSVSEEVGSLAVLTKMIRVACLVPVVMMLALYFQAGKTAEQSSKPTIPLFLIAFFVLMAINSLITIPEMIEQSAIEISRFALITAIAAVGLKTNLRDVVAVGFKPIALIAMQTTIMALIILAFVLYW